MARSTLAHANESLKLLDEIKPEAGAFSVLDQAYIDFQRLFFFALSSAFFVVRTKSNSQMWKMRLHAVRKRFRQQPVAIPTVFGSTPSAALACEELS